MTTKAKRKTQKRKRRTGTKVGEPSRGRVGRPTLYKPEFVEQATKLCEQGCTEFEIAEHFHVDRMTLYRWKAAHPEFRDALRLAKAVADDRVEVTLYERATGYTYNSEEIKVVEGEVVRVPVQVHVPPDNTAAIFWLKNRRRDEWRDRHDVQLAGKVSLEQMVAASYAPEQAKDETDSETK